MRRFRKIAYRLRGKSFGVPKEPPPQADHPFDERNIHRRISHVSKKLFDDGHYKQATLEAYTLIDNTMSKLSGCDETGYKLMMQALNEKNPLFSFNALSNKSEVDEQRGYKFIFAGASSGIRNPRAHEVDWPEDVNQCLDHLSLASLLLRKIDGVLADKE